MASFDYTNTKDRKVYNALMPVAKLLAKIVFNIKYEGIENFPEKGGYIFASNHIVAVDPVYISTRSPHPIHYMAKSETFKNAFTSGFLTHFNAFPVVRGAGDMSAIDYAVKLVKDGRVLGIFPEGTRSKDLKPGRAKSGVALIAKMAHADVMPVSIRFEGKPKFRAKVVVRYGKPIPFEELGLDDESSSASLKTASRIIMDRIVELWEGTTFD